MGAFHRFINWLLGNPGSANIAKTRFMKMRQDWRKPHTITPREQNPSSNISFSSLPALDLSILSEEPLRQTHPASNTENSFTFIEEKKERINDQITSKQKRKKVRFQSFEDLKAFRDVRDNTSQIQKEKSKPPPTNREYQSSMSSPVEQFSFDEAGEKEIFVQAKSQSSPQKLS